MFSSAEKTNHHPNAAQQKAAGTTFFRKAGEETFFGSTEGGEKASFFGAAVQAKLSVSNPDDPQEKEADAVASHVMRIAEPAMGTEKKEEEKVQRKEEKEDEKLHAKRQSPVITMQRKCDHCEHEEKTQAKLYRKIERSEEAFASTADYSDAETDTGAINRKASSLYHSDVIQCSGRGPPATSIPFEQNLASSQGAGSPLPSDTRQFMESRFSADFSGVRIHTGSQAESLSSNIHAHAFAHGSDIYFNSGKYSPNTEAGGTLLAHELTHTIQQGASTTYSANAGTTTTVSRKNIIQRSATGVPSQLTNAIAKAKTVEGQIDANKPQGDGNRTGWEHLVEIFKSTFGEEMIVKGNGSAQKGAVAEEDIKKKREQHGLMIVDKTTVTDRNAVPKTTTGSRDAMPSWCGIFVFWALNKSGVSMPKWKLGERMIKPEAARTPGADPLPGDIAYRNAYSHFAIVESVNGGTVTTVNGNTAGEDNLGGQVQTKDHPLSDWTAFFNPLQLMTGALGSGESAPQESPKTLAELRQEMEHVNRKEGPGEDEMDSESENIIQAKQDLGSWSVDAKGTLQTITPAIQKATDDKELQKKEDDKKEEEKSHEGLVLEFQKKSETQLSAQGDSETCNKCNPASPGSILARSENDNSSLTYANHVTINENLSDHERGPPVQLKTETGIVQRSVIDDALGFAGSVTDCISTSLNESKVCALGKAQTVAMHIPGYKALRVVLGRDPISGDGVARNGRNFIEAAFDIMPAGELLYQKLDEQHQLDAAAAWIDEKIASLETIVNDLFSEIDQFWNALGLSDLTSPLEVLRDGVGIAMRFIGRVVDFAVDAAKELLEMVKQFLLDKIVEFIKENTTAYPLLTVILGEDPVTKQRVDRNGTNILNALLELGGEEGRMQRDQMMETGTFQKVVAYIDEGITVFSDLYNTIVQNFSAIWELVSIDALMNPIETFRRIYNIFAAPVTRVLDWMSRVVAEILKLIKEVLFKRISEEAKKVRGYYLVTVLISKDPFTGQSVPRSVENLIHGFMSLMDGGEEQFQQMKESGAIDKATQKVNAAVKRLNMTFESVVQLFIDLWNSFTFSDFLHPIATFQRIIAKFGEPIGGLIAFLIEIVKIVVEVILIIMNFPFDLINNIIAKAMQAYELIKRDPIGFLKNLLRAIKEGFMQFFDNILTHLFNGLKTWFLGEVQAAGIPIPTDFTVMGIIKWLLAVLDVTMEKIWKKLEERIGKPKVDKIKKMIDTAQRVASAAGEAYAFMQDVQQRGFMAVMIDKVKEQLSNVWEMVLDAVKGFVMNQIIKKVTTKLLSMLDPTGIMAVVNSAIALYKAIQSFIKYLRQMLEIVNSFVEGTLQIAQGATKKAADFLEGALARGIPIVIGFLANQVGLNLSERLKDALEIVREKVDKALTWVIDKLVTLIEKLVGAGPAPAQNDEQSNAKKTFHMNGEDHTIFLTFKSGKPVIEMASGRRALLRQLAVNALQEIKDKHGAPWDEMKVKINDLLEKELDPLTEQLVSENHSEQFKTPADYESALAGVTSLLTLIGDQFHVKTLEFVLPASTPVKWGPQYNGFASSMEIDILTKTGPAGSGVNNALRNVGHMKKLDKRRNGSSPYYVLGHLLNDNLHGPGNTFDNLSPITGSANGLHETQVESSIKTGIENDRIFKYKVQADYSRGYNSLMHNYFLARGDTTRGEIVEAEQYVPAQFICTAQELQQDGTPLSGGLSISKPIPVNITQTPNSYDV